MEQAARGFALRAAFRALAAATPARRRASHSGLVRGLRFSRTELVVAVARSGADVAVLACGGVLPSHHRRTPAAAHRRSTLAVALENVHSRGCAVRNGEAVAREAAHARREET